MAVNRTLFHVTLVNYAISTLVSQYLAHTVLRHLWVISNSKPNARKRFAFVYTSTILVCTIVQSVFCTPQKLYVVQSTQPAQSTQWAQIKDNTNCTVTQPSSLAWLSNFRLASFQLIIILRNITIVIIIIVIIIIMGTPSSSS